MGKRCEGEGVERGDKDGWSSTIKGVFFAFLLMKIAQIVHRISLVDSQETQ